jgi:pimeloyl-ACP methyl ester carboxylesterase
VARASGRLLARLDRWVLSTVMTAMYAPRRPRAGRAAWFEELRYFIEALEEDELLPPPPPLEPRLVREVPARDAAHAFVVRWRTSHVPAWSSLELSRDPSDAVALLCEPTERRTVVLVLHSWWGGWWSLSRRVWPVRELLEAGHAVAMPILPGHASRRTSGKWLVPQFPGRNPLVNFLTVADTLVELRQFIVWLMSRGYERVVVTGSSLGGYFAALLGTVEPRIHGLVLDRPLVSLAQPPMVQKSPQTTGEGARSAEDGASGALGAPVEPDLAALYRRLCPFARPLCIAAHRTSVIMGRHDGLTTVEATRKLCEHFGVEPILTEESHLVGYRRRGRMAQVLSAISSESEAPSQAVWASSRNDLP